MCAYRDESGMFTTAPLELDEDTGRAEHREAVNTSLEKVFNMDSRWWVPV